MYVWFISAHHYSPSNKLYCTVIYLPGNRLPGLQDMLNNLQVIGIFSLALPCYSTIHSTTDTSGQRAVDFWMNFNIKISEPETWTMRSLFAINYTLGEEIVDIDTAAESSITLNAGYLRFRLRYLTHQFIIVLIDTTSNEATKIALLTSGFLFSDHTIFVKFEGKTDSTDDFEMQFPNFVLYNELLKTFSIQCKNFQRVYTSISNELQQLLYRCQQKSFNIAGQWHASTLEVKPVSNAIKNIDCISSKRKIMYHSLRFCQSGYMTGLLLAAQKFNLTFEPEPTTDLDQEYDKVLLVYWIPLLDANLPNAHLYYRSKMRLLIDSDVVVMFCTKMADTVNTKYEKNFWSFDNQVQVILLIIFLTFSFVYKSFSKGFGLFWLLVNKPLTRKHLRKLVFAYMVSSIFLTAHHSAVFSTNQVTVRIPISLKELTLQKYKFHVQPHVFNNLMKILSNRTKLQFSNAFRVTKFENLFEFHNESVRLEKNLEKVARLRALGLGNSGRPVFSSSIFLGKILAISDKVLINNTFLCSSITIPDKTVSNMRFGYITWGALSTELNIAFGKLAETGIVSRLQYYVTQMTQKTQNTSFIPLKISLRVPSSLKMNSLVGNFGLLQIYFGCFVLFIFSVYFHSQQDAAYKAIFKTSFVTDLLSFTKTIGKLLHKFRFPVFFLKDSKKFNICNCSLNCAGCCKYKSKRRKIVLVHSNKVW